jgi:4a-hydroxytetrahydrobiopterin dehydratase
MDNLSDKKCVPCEGGLDPMTRDDFSVYLEQVDKWTIREDKYLIRDFQFTDFVTALAWVNKVGEIAEEEGHHPDICIHAWNKVTITLWTHAIGGLSINDFVLATKIDRV